MEYVLPTVWLYGRLATSLRRFLTIAVFVATAGLCARGAEITVGVYPGVGDTSILAALAGAKGIRGQELENYSPDTLSELRVVMIPHGQSVNVRDEVRPWRAMLRRYVELGGAIVLTHNAVGYRGVFAGEELFGEIETAIPPEPGVPGGGGGRKDAWMFRKVADGTHPLAARLPGEIRHAYCDHIAMYPGPLGEVVCIDDDGDATVIAGAFGRGRVVAIGALVGARAKVQKLRHYDEELVAPKGAERALLLEALRWAGSAAHFDGAAMKRALETVADEPQGKPMVVFSSNFNSWRLDRDEWIVPPDPRMEKRDAWHGHGLGEPAGRVGEVFVHDRPLVARQFKTGDVSGRFVLSFDAVKASMFAGALDITLTNPEGWGYGARLVYVAGEDSLKSQMTVRQDSHHHQVVVGSQTSGVFRVEKGAVTMLAESKGAHSRLRMPRPGDGQVTKVPVRFERTSDGWMTLRIGGRVIAAARDTMYGAFTRLSLTLRSPKGRLAVDTLRLTGYYTEVEEKVFAPAPIVLPEPKEMKLSDEKFALVHGAQFVVDDGEKVGTYCLAEFIEDIAGHHGVRLRAVVRGREDRRLPIIDLSELAEAVPQLGAEGYTLQVTARTATVRGTTEKATFYGLCSLYQLVTREDGQAFIRGATIRDWPDLEWRGAIARMMGSTGMRHHVPVLKDQVKMLARLKGNVLITGTKRLPFPSYPQIAGYDNRWTMDEFVELVEYARAHHLDVWPKVHGLSHSGWLYFLAKKEPKFWEWVKEHKVLGAPDAQSYHADAFNPASPEAIDLILKTGDDVIRACGAKTVFIHMDEVLPPISEMVPGRDPAEVLAEYLNKHHGHLAKQGVRMAMYADTLMEYGKYGPSCASSGSPHYKDVTHRALDMIPKDIILLDWNYTDRPGRPSYAHLKSKGFDAVGVPGTCYGPLYASIYHSTTEAKKAGIKGIIEFGWNTAWHLNPQHTTVLPFIYAWTVPTKMEPDWCMQEVWQRLYQGPRPSHLGVIEPIDISKTLNESRTDDAGGDGAGWFDYGRSADMSAVPGGKRTYQHLRFEIADEKITGGKGAVIVATSDSGAKVATEVQGIGIGLKAKSLVFLHIATEGPHSKPIGRYVVHYTDATTADVPIIYGQNIGPWLLEKGHTSGFYGVFYKHGYLSESLLAYTGATRSGERVALQSYEWVNPHPDKTIESLDMIATDPGSRTYARKVRIALLALSAVK